MQQRFLFRRLDSNSGSDGRRVPTDTGQRTARPLKVLATGERGSKGTVMVTDGFKIKTITEDEIRV